MERTSSTFAAFFRSMLERGDLLALHEPFCNLTCFGETDGLVQTFHSAASLLTWLRDETNDVTVFLKDTPTTGSRKSSPTGASSPMAGTPSLSAAPRRSPRPTTRCTPK